MLAKKRETRFQSTHGTGIIDGNAPVVVLLGHTHLRLAGEQVIPIGTTAPAGTVGLAGHEDGEQKNAAVDHFHVGKTFVSFVAKCVASWRFYSQKSQVTHVVYIRAEVLFVFVLFFFFLFFFLINFPFRRSVFAFLRSPSLSRERSTLLSSSLLPAARNQSFDKRQADSRVY